VGLAAADDLVHELVREPVDLAGDEGDEAQAGDQALHLVLPMDLDPELVPQQVVEPVGAPARRHDPHALAHAVERDLVELGGALDEATEEVDAGLDLVRLEPRKVERAAGEVARAGPVEEVGRERGGSEEFGVRVGVEDERGECTG